ncbi:peptidoglycan-associated lipoprotein Pal [Motiliproteus sp. SC1-56]|uniref:peptidoglycan-associated lipoprotein Pal n=1 Tax=Motiliproteus sp. SC1-56 TaxID=2799565 RepID=UPI00351C77C8
MDQADQRAEQDAAAATGAGAGESMQGSQMGTDSSAMDQGAADVTDLQTVFYFDFDRAVVKSEAFEALTAHAQYLLDNPSAKAVLEGHADERGTREYNMALGERRAKAVSRYLTVQGVPGQQIETVSYGEERPAVVGHSEAAWSENRRVELKYESR